MTLSEATDLILEMTAELREARRDSAAYQLVAQQAIHALHEHQVRDQQRERRYYELLAELRELRQTVRRAA